MGSRMLSALFASLAVAEVVLLTLVLTMRRRHPDWALTLLSLVIIALIWDNTIIAVGATVGEGRTLEALSYPPCSWPRPSAPAFWTGNLGELLLILSIWWTAAHTVRPARLTPA
jgi:hypothetical protein